MILRSLVSHSYAGLLGRRSGPRQKHLREAPRLSPNLAGAHNNLSNLLATRGALDEAIAHFLAAIRRNISRACLNFYVSERLTPKPNGTARSQFSAPSGVPKATLTNHVLKETLHLTS